MTEEDRDKLRPCTCGGKAKFYRHVWVENPDKQRYELKCEDCGYSTGQLKTEDEVVEAWNTGGEKYV